ncbi:MAG: hypothetical protein DRQ51_06880 [Gammaproteobacteria bacterium]|nr:MAG: hypothetical protein DRQ51_06880 [Gammaproteobacteria bacterium]
MLIEIEEYIKKRDSSKLSDIAIHFDMSENLAKLMIDKLVIEKKIMTIQAGCPTSGSCSSKTCHPKIEKYYKSTENNWVKIHF